MSEDNNMQKMLEIIHQITNEIPEQYQKHIFWSPKTNSDDGKVVGFRLYAYGGYVLKIFMEEDHLTYETNFHKYKDNYFGDLWDEKFEKERSNVCKKSININTLMRITSLWGNILEAYRKRMYGEGAVTNKYLERGRATAIARNLELHSKLKDFYFIEQESRIKVSKKKPDLIGVRNKNGKTVISFIEYNDIASIKVNGKDLVAKEDYIIVPGSYKNNIQKGTATVQLKGIGNYGGTVTVKFKIKQKNFLWRWLLESLPIAEMILEVEKVNKVRFKRNVRWDVPLFKKRRRFDDKRCNEGIR